MWEQEWDFDPVVGIRQLPGRGTPRQGHGVFQGEGRGTAAGAPRWSSLPLCQAYS